MSKKLSIIVPVYNMATEGKLNYCLDSLVGQTIRGLYDYEILCVDDALSLIHISEPTRPY